MKPSFPPHPTNNPRFKGIKTFIPPSNADLRVIWRGIDSIRRVSIVLAHWCLHCVPLSLDYATRMAEILRVPLRVLDIDLPEQLRQPDDLVRECGDWCEDYLIPQVFIEQD